MDQSGSSSGEGAQQRVNSVDAAQSDSSAGGSVNAGRRKMGHQLIPAVVECREYV